MTEKAATINFGRDIPSTEIALSGLIAECGGFVSEHIPKHGVFAVRLALEEALVNAVKHGNEFDPEKTVSIKIDLVRTSTMLVVDIVIQDEGCGFDPEDIPNPLATSNLDKPSGRGLFLMHHYMSEVSHLEGGKLLKMKKEIALVQEEGLVENGTQGSISS